MKAKCIEPMGVHARVITPEDGGHYFFGYYDLQPFDSTGRYHLCHRAEFEDRIPTENDPCQLGAIDLETGDFIRFAETTAWNFQQGALLQWYRDDDHVIYNVREGSAFRSCVQNVKTGEKRILPMAFANLSQDGKHALCINFSRLFDFRPGYGYAGIPDPYAHINAPKEDGIFLMDTETGDCKMILSYTTLRDAFYEEPYSAGKLLVNHITFNPAGDRFVILLRNFKKLPENPLFRTQLLTCDLEGNLFRLAPFGYESHYHWKNDRELLIFGAYDDARARGNGSLWLYQDLTASAAPLPEPNPKKDVHCLYSPNRRYILGDAYPNEEEYRPLYLIDTEEGVQYTLGEYLSYINVGDDRQYRCDLHARFRQDGRYLSFDSIHPGKRCVCMMDLAPLKGYRF